MSLIPAIQDQATDQIFLVLLTFTDAQGNATPVRFVNNNEEVVSRGQRFMPYPFEISLPEDSDSRSPVLKLAIDNVDQVVVEAVREFIEPPTVKVEIVLSGNPNTVEKAIDFLRMTNVSYNALTVEATLEPLDVLSQRAVEDTYTPADFPDLHYT